MTESSIYGSTRELMTSTDAIEKASGDVTFKRRSLLSRQRSCQSFEMGSRKIDQVRPQKSWNEGNILQTFYDKF